MGHSQNQTRPCRANFPMACALFPQNNQTGDAMFEGSDPKVTFSPRLQTKITIAVGVIVAGVVALNAVSGFQFGNWNDQQRRAELSRTSSPL